MPGRGRGVLDVFRRGYLLRLLVRKATATRYRNSVLGWVWSYVKPASQFAVYYFVIGIVLNAHRDIVHFPVYLFAGIVVVNLFNEAFGNATSSIVDNGALVRKIYLPRELFPIAAIIVAFVHFLPQVAVLLLICLLVGWSPTVLGIVAILAGAAIVVLFAMGLGLFFSGLNVRYRDAQNLVEIIRMFATWTSPVLYPWALVYERAPDWLFPIYMSNPLTVAVELFHYGFWGRTVEGGAQLAPHFSTYALISLVVCALMLVIGQVTFRRFERSFAQDL